MCLTLKAQDPSASSDSTKVATVISDSLQLDTVKPDSATVANSIKEEGQKQLEENLNTNLPKDSAALANEARAKALQELNQQTGINISGVPTDSTQVANEAKQVAKDQLQNELGVDVPDIKLDSTSKDQLQKEAANQAESALKNTDEFQSLGGDEDALGGLSPQELQQMNAKKEMKQKMASHAKEFISEHSDQIQEVQEQMSELKKKYSEVPNSNDLSTAKKRSSLKGERLKTRLTFGGNFNVTGTNPLTIDLSPTVGYKFNKLFEMGITAAYRTQFGSDNVNAPADNEVYGYSIYANHKVFKNFFAYLEGENMSKSVTTEASTKREWYPSLLAGIGRSFKVSKTVEIQAIITYNFLHSNTEGVYENPIVFKTGVRINK